MITGSAHGKTGKYDLGNPIRFAENTVLSAVKKTWENSVKLVDNLK
jgi:hypothetical protein